MVLRKILHVFWKSSVLAELRHLPVHCGGWGVQGVIDEPHVSLVQLQSQRIIVSFVQ